MRKGKIIAISIAVCLVLFAGWNLYGLVFGNPLVLMTISRDAHRYMEETYHEEIVVDRAYFSEISYNYCVDAHFAEVPDFTFKLWANHDMLSGKISGDNVIESYWKYELDLLFGGDIRDSFACLYEIDFGELCCVGYTGENPYDITKLPGFYDCWEDIKGEAGILITLEKDYVEGVSEEEILAFSQAMQNKAAVPGGYLNVYGVTFKNGVYVGIVAGDALDTDYVKGRVKML